MEIHQNNPWSVKNLDEFLYYCCPECDVRNHSKELFLQHAFENHPDSKNCLPILIDVKKEIKTVDEYDNGEFTGYLMSALLF